MVDRNEIENALRSTDPSILLNLRGRLVEKKKSIESQLADDTAGMREERNENLVNGMHPREADLRAQASGDPDWRARASGLCRIIDGALSRIRVRLSELTPSAKFYTAVAIENAGKTSALVASALNQFLGRGSKIAFALVVDGDLVVVASEPST